MNGGLLFSCIGVENHETRYENIRLRFCSLVRSHANAKEITKAQEIIMSLDAPLVNITKESNISTYMCM